jgi:pyruvate,water dikinase
VTIRSRGQGSPELDQAIREACRRLGAEAVAGRSSATAEDLETASFAGQQDTFLNVRGEEAALDAVRISRLPASRRRAAVLPRRGHKPEAGGQLSHAAVVAREYGLPAVAGVRGATQVLKNGRLILVDGTSGRLHVLKG